MQLEIIKNKSKLSTVPSSLIEILNLPVPVIIQIDKPSERMNGFEQRKAQSGRNVREKILYTDADSDRNYCGGTFINDYETGVYWELNRKTNIFERKEGEYWTRHLDKLMGTADHYLLKDTITEFLTSIKAEGHIFE